MIYCTFSSFNVTRGFKYCTFSSFKVTRGFKRLKPRGRKCAEITNRYLDLATGRMYAQKRFGEKEKQHVRLLSFTQSNYCLLNNQITANLHDQVTVFYTPIPHRPRIAWIATNWFFIDSGGGILEVSLIFFLESGCSTSQSQFRYDFVTNIRGNRLNLAGIAQEFITISKITLAYAARKLRNQLRIS